jgi:hypothetical protein
MKTAEILVWDFSSCESQSTDFISHLQRYRKSSFSNIIVAAKDPSKLPPALGDVAVVLPITLRLGINALLDSVADSISLFSQAKGNCSFVVISNSWPLWITLFQRLEPKSVTFVSSKDPKSCLEFSFLPDRIPVRVLAWPALAEISASGQQKSPPSPSSLHESESVVDEERHETEEEQPSTFGEEETPPRPVPPIQPLRDMESHHIDLRSPLAASPPQQPEVEVPQKREVKAQAEQSVQVPAKFKAVVEVMRGVGKLMVPIQELEAQLRAYSSKTGEAIENPSSYITKAGDAQILLIDKSINYVRFRNRALLTAVITYG